MKAMKVFCDSKGVNTIIRTCRYRIVLRPVIKSNEGVIDLF